MDDRIQEGVFFRKGETPPPHFSIVFIRVSESGSKPILAESLMQLWQSLQRLKSGETDDLPGYSSPSGGLSITVGYGPALFDTIGQQGIAPSELKRFRSPLVSGGGSVSLGSGLSYGASITENLADCAISLQFLAQTQLSVKRAVVETWKQIEKINAQFSTEVLRIIAAYDGFGRDDRRSWIGFFDGTSNLRSDQRLDAIEIKPRSVSAPDSWKERGCYLCFMRIRVDLAPWQMLSRTQQETLVGRDKLTGCALHHDQLSNEINPVPGCPVATGGHVEDGQNSVFREAPRPAGSPSLRQSHIHRANQGRSNVSDPESRRVFRQGYEFLDGINTDGQPIVGLNFVSFQDTPERVLGMLKLRDWLGGVNFGGDETNQLPGMASLLTVDSAGFFVCPPSEASGEIPGSQVFSEQLIA